MAEMSGEWEVWDDEEFDQVSGDPGRSRVVRVLAIGVVVAAAVGFVPRWARSLSNSSSARGGSGVSVVGPAGSPTPGAPVVTSATVATTTADTPSTSAGRPPSAPAAAVPPATVAATTTAPATTAPGTTAAATTVAGGGGVAGERGVAVSTLQIVPALRGVVVDIGGQRFVSDADGAIQVPSVRQHGVATVIGIADQPSLRRVGFLQWADGDRRTMRSLDSLSGPVAQIGFTLSYRVVVQVPGDGPAVVRFTSEAGPVSLKNGSAQWVPAAQAVGGPGGLTTQEFSYVVSTYERGGVATPVPAQTFLSSPEALWRVG